MREPRPALPSGLHAAMVLLFVRAGWTGSVAVSFLLASAAFWTLRPSRSADTSGIIFMLTFAIAGGLALLGAAALAIAVPSLVFGALIFSRKAWAQWVALIGEILLALAVAGLAVWGFGHNDVGPAEALIGSLALFSAPVIVLMARHFVASRPA